MLRIMTVAGTAALLAAGAAIAQDGGSMRLDRLALADGEATVSVLRELGDREADFVLSVSRTYSDGEMEGETGGESFDSVRLAGRKRPARLRVVRPMCDEVVGIVGTVTRQVVRVEVVAPGGEVTRLPRHAAPRAWRFRGRLVGAVLASDAAVREVRARLRGGKVVARVKPAPAVPCP